MKFVITGAAGFIGSHLSERLVAKGHEVVGVDNFDPFYEERIKRGNLFALEESDGFELVAGDIRDATTWSATPLESGPPDCLVHLAAKAGVRPSILDPVGYADVNVRGTARVMEYMKQAGVPKLVMASSSSVYGNHPDVPWREDAGGLRPISPYAATKLSCEFMADVFQQLNPVQVVALRFFTVYGPRQRPDLAIHKFAKLISAGKEISMFGNGTTSRDYTYIDDILHGIERAIEYDGSPYEIFNLGNDRRISLADMILTIEEALGKKARIRQMPEQDGDVQHTCASVEKSLRLLGYRPETSFSVGIAKFVEWLQANGISPKAPS